MRSKRVALQSIVSRPKRSDLYFASRLSLPVGVPLDGATLFWLVCASVYVYLETLGGCSAAVFYCALLFHTHRLYLSLGQSAALQLALVVHVASWFAQVVVGHALIEKRRPALLDSLLPSLLLAPFFVVLEVACASAHETLCAALTLTRFSCAVALGYKPDLHAKLLAATRRELDKLRARDT